MVLTTYVINWSLQTPTNTNTQIIVGGGTAGLALATRLSQRLPQSSILVLEAGPAAPDELGINIPARRGSTIGSKYDWNFTTIPQAAVKNRVISHPRGHVLGGSSALNFMTWDRAVRSEYESWQEVGNPGWGWKEFSRAMRKSENFTSVNSEWYGDEGVGRKGPIQGTINRYNPAWQNTWIPTLNSLGIPTNREYQAGNTLGVWYSSSSIDPSHYNRSYSANSYLPLAGPNLVVASNSLVAKVELVGGSRSMRATGVRLLNGTFITAKKEVILSAGSFGSPVLLELSGIGQRDILRKAGIFQTIELPGVGENLQDHIRLSNVYQLKDNFTGVDRLNYDPVYAAEQLELWISGKLSHWDYTGSAYTFQTWNQATGSNKQLLYLAQEVVKQSPSVADKKKLEWLSDQTVPQLEVIMSDGYLGVKGYPPRNSSLYGKNFFALIAAIMHPLARGNVHINTSDPLGKPVIDPRYLSNEHDIRAAIEGIKKVRQIALTPPLRDIWVSEFEPGLETVKSDADWREYVLNATLSIYHPVGTCAMLPKSQGGVVDSQLKVYGTTNLRVADVSIVPVLISGHTQSAAYGVGEIAADIVVKGAEAQG